MNAFPHRLVNEMEESHVTLLLLTHTFDISHDLSTNNVISLTPL